MYFGLSSNSFLSRASHPYLIGEIYCIQLMRIDTLFKFDITPESKINGEIMNGANWIATTGLVIAVPMKNPNDPAQNTMLRITNRNHRKWVIPVSSPTPKYKIDA